MFFWCNVELDKRYTNVRALIIDDDQELAKILRSILEKQHFSVDTLFDGGGVVERVKKHEYDVVILDLNLPDADGVEVCQSLRTAGYIVPVIMLTARRTTIDKITGLDAGADDYLPKPFSPDELMARIRAVLRRPEQSIGDVLQVGDLKVHTLEHKVTRAGREIELMPKEYALLEYMARKPSTLLRKEELLSHVWGIYSRTGSNRLEVYIRYLREKIDEPFETKLIKTVRGSGYKICEPTR